MKRLLVTLFLVLSILAGSFALLHTSLTHAALAGSLSGTEGAQPYSEIDDRRNAGLGLLV